MEIFSMGPQLGTAYESAAYAEQIKKQEAKAYERLMRMATLQGKDVEAAAFHEKAMSAHRERLDAVTIMNQEIRAHNEKVKSGRRDTQ